MPVFTDPDAILQAAVEFQANDTLIGQGAIWPGGAHQAPQHSATDMLVKVLADMAAANLISPALIPARAQERQHS
jgi:hypothetical protein